MGFTSPSGKIPSITLVLNLVIVSSLRCGAQRCIPFTPYFTFDHWIPKYRQTRPQPSDARIDLQIFGVFCGSGLTPPQIREQVVFGPSRCDFPTFLAKSDLLAVLSGHPSACRVRSGSTPKMDTQSKSCTRTVLCLIPRFLRPYRSCGRAENEREYGGDDEECPSGSDGVDRAECWYRPSCDEVPDHTC